MDSIDGYKTYIVAGVMVIYASAGMYFMILTPEAGINIIMAAGALIGLGHKLDKSTKAKQEVKNAPISHSDSDTPSDKVS